MCKDRRQPGNRRRPERVPVAPEEKNPFPGRADRDINVEPVWTGGNPVNDINVAVVDKGMKHLHAAPLENVAAERNHDYNGANPNLTWRDNKIILAISARRNDTTEPGWEEGGLKFDSSTERYQFNNSTGSGSSTPRPPWTWQRTGARCPNSVRPSARRDR